MTNQELLALLQSAEMDLYESDVFVDGEWIITRIKITEACEEITARIRKAERITSTA